jgi:FAD/FMN-containing dehydrogenase
MNDAVQALLAELGPDIVLAGEAVPPRNRSDWSGLPPTEPMAVIRPRATGEVAAALRVCHAHGLPVVPQGGLTGLCGGARAGDGEVALSLERMVGIEEIDPATATLTVRAGTPLEQVQRAADEAGFLLALDLGARGSCAIGGNLSTNAGGNRVIRYGMAREMVLGLEVVLADGTVMTSLNKMLKNNAGFDLKQLFVGSEGTLGVITRAVLRLHPKPTWTAAALCGCTLYADVVRLLDAARRGLGPLLSAYEVMWQPYYRLVTERVAGMRAPIGPEHGFYVLVEAQGSGGDEDGPARFEAWLEAAAEAGMLADGAVAQSLADVQAFWALRDAAGEFRALLGPHQSFDIGLPVAVMADYATACDAALRERLPGIVALFYGHVGDGNIHIVIAVPGAAAQPKAQVEEVVYGLVRDFGGTVSAEHGIGTLKRRWLGHARSDAEIALMRTLKAALDPKNILNPGKVI